MPAIEQAIYEGININVTLLFGVEAYTEIAEAYIRGLERRHAEALPLDIHSVASFFVSRVDTEVDKRLEALRRSDLAGTAALANARAAYARYEEIFLGSRFAELRAAGARVQRPLWASTGTKNPAYSETKYVDGLVAPDTVNTMPMKTLLAVAERGAIEPDSARRDPTPELEALAAAGIDMEDVTSTLLRAGIEAFVTPMNKLLAGIDNERQAILTGRPPAIAATIPAELGEAIAARVARAVEERVARRVWEKDESLWGGPGVPEIGDRLGWLTISDSMLERADELVEFARAAAADGLTDAVLLGMGGSSLAPEVLWRTFGAPPEALALHVLDSTDPAAIRAVEDAIDLDRTLFVVSTKSGGTIETLSLFEHFHSIVDDGSRFVAITDPGSSLLELARANSVPHGVRERPEHWRPLFGAVAVRPRPGGVDGSAGPRAARARRRRRAGLRALRLDRLEPGTVARARARRARAARPRQAHLRRRGPGRELRPVGRAAGRREHGQAGARESSRSRTSRCSSPTPTAPIACSSTSATTSEPTRTPTPGSRRSPPPATQR